MAKIQVLGVFCEAGEGAWLEEAGQAPVVPAPVGLPWLQAAWGGDAGQRGAGGVKLAWGHEPEPRLWPRAGAASPGGKQASCQRGGTGPWPSLLGTNNGGALSKWVRGCPKAGFYHREGQCRVLQCVASMFSSHHWAPCQPAPSLLPSANSSGTSSTSSLGRFFGFACLFLWCFFCGTF